MTAKTYKFEHKGKTFEIPTLSAMPIGAVRKARKIEDETDKLFTMLETVMPEGSPALAAIDSMDTETFAKFLEGWTQGAPLGESSSSES